MTEKERINLNVCCQCEYEDVCFPILKFIHRYKAICKQGRKRKQFREKQTTSPKESV